MPGLLRVKLGQTKLFPDFFGAHHEFFLRQRERREVGFARRVDQERRLAIVVTAGRMSCHHADGRGSEGPIADDFKIFVRLRAVGDRPGDRDGIVDVDVFVDGDDHFADAVAVIKNALHDIPGFLVVAFLQD